MTDTHESSDSDESSNNDESSDSDESSNNDESSDNDDSRDSDESNVCSDNVGYGASNWHVVFTRHRNSRRTLPSEQFWNLFFVDEKDFPLMESPKPLEIFLSTFPPFDIEYIDAWFPLVPITIFMQEPEPKGHKFNKCYYCQKIICHEEYINESTKESLYLYCSNSMKEDYWIGNDYIVCMNCYEKDDKKQLLPVKCLIIPDIYIDIAQDTSSLPKSSDVMIGNSSWCSRHPIRSPFYICNNCEDVVSANEMSHDNDLWAPILCLKCSAKEKQNENDDNNDNYSSNDRRYCDECGCEFEDCVYYISTLLPNYDLCLQCYDSQTFVKNGPFISSTSTAATASNSNSMNAGIIRNSCKCCYDIQREISWIFPRRPNTFCVHSKISLVKFTTFLRVIISSFNISFEQEDSAGDEYWYVDVPEKLDLSGNVSEFQRDLCHLLLEMSTPKWANLIMNYDFSKVDDSDIHLIASIPGKHTSTKYGYMRLNHVLEKMPRFGRTDMVDAQVWSMGGSYYTWYDNMISVLTQQRPSSSNYNSIRFIFENGVFYDSRCYTRDRLFYDSTNPLFMQKIDKTFSKHLADMISFNTLRFLKHIEVSRMSPTVINILNIGFMINIVTTSVVARAIIKAALKPNSSYLYAKFIRRLRDACPIKANCQNPNHNDNFFRTLLYCVQEKFETSFGKSYSLKTQNIYCLIAHLYLFKVLTEKIIHEIIRRTLVEKECSEDRLKALCMLFKIVGRSLDHERAKSYIDAYIHRMESMCQLKNMTISIEVMIQDLNILRNNGWEKIDESTSITYSIGFTFPATLKCGCFIYSRIRHSFKQLKENNESTNTVDEESPLTNDIVLSKLSITPSVSESSSPTLISTTIESNHELNSDVVVDDKPPSTDDFATKSVSQSVQKTSVEFLPFMINPLGGMYRFKKLKEEVPSWGWHSKRLLRTYHRSECSCSRGTCTKQHGWMYIGSHNFSAASWGSWDSNSPNVSMLKNWEVGVVIRSMPHRRQKSRSNREINEDICGVDLKSVPCPFNRQSLVKYNPDTMNARTFSCVRHYAIVTYVDPRHMYVNVKLLDPSSIDKRKMSVIYVCDSGKCTYKVKTYVFMKCRKDYERCWMSGDLIGLCLQVDINVGYKEVVWICNIYERKTLENKGLFYLSYNPPENTDLRLFGLKEPQVKREQIKKSVWSKFNTN